MGWTCNIYTITRKNHDNANCYYRTRNISGCFFSACSLGEFTMSKTGSMNCPVCLEWVAQCKCESPDGGMPDEYFEDDEKKDPAKD